MSIKHRLGRFVLCLVAFFELFCVVAVFTSWVGLFLKLVGGRQDFSGWMIMSAAERPTSQLLLQMGLSIVWGALGIFIMIITEDWHTNQKSAKILNSIRHWRSAFEKGKHNPFKCLWITSFFGFYLSSYIWSLVRLLIDGEWYYPLSLANIGGFALGVLTSAVLASLFVSLSSWIKQDWVLLPTWGLVNAVVGIGYRAVASTIVSGSEIPAPLGRMWMAESFLVGLFLMAGVVYGVRIGGLRYRSLALGCALSFVLGRVSAMVLILDMSLPVHQLIWSAFDGTLFGSLIYAGFYLSLPKRQAMQSRIARPHRRKL